MLVFKDGEQEVYGLKMQIPSFSDKHDAVTMYWIFRCAIAAGLSSYLEHEHKGLMVPCAYFKKRAEDAWDAGVAFLSGRTPQANGRKK